MSRKYKLNQRVKCHPEGWGEIVAFDSNNNDGYCIRFDNGGPCSFNLSYFVPFKEDDRLLYGYRFDSEIIDEQREVINAVGIKPTSFEIQSGECKAFLCGEEFDFWDFDVEHIEDIIAVATTAKELYKEHFKQ